MSVILSPQPIARPFQDGVEGEHLFRALERQHGFKVDTSPDICVDALTYELPGHSLNNYCHLLASTRPGEPVDRNRRIMGCLWYGTRYADGLALEVFGKDIVDHMTKIANRIQNGFDDEIQVVVRTLKSARYL